MPNNQLSISANTPVIAGTTNKFDRNWYNFFVLVLARVRMLAGTTSSTATAGAAAALPATPEGYLDFVHPTTGEAIKVAYYKV